MANSLTGTEQAQAQSKHRKLTRLKFARRIFLMIIGTILVSIGLEIFLVPNHIIDGGIVGISIILSHLSGFPSVYFLLYSICRSSCSGISKLAKPLPYPPRSRSY